MAKVHTFEVGYCTHPACMAQQGAGLASRRFPARAYLLETRSGLYLLDTGYSEHFQTHARGVYRAYGWVTPVHYQHEQENLALQLKKRGVTPKDLRGILISHFHADHVAGLQDYPGVPLYASKDAVRSIRGLSDVNALRKAFIPGLLPKDFESRLCIVEETPLKRYPKELSPFHYGWALDPLGEVLVVALPGHAEGQLGAFVQSSSGWVLLAADAAWSPEGYRSLKGPSELSFLVQHSRKEYYDTLAKLHLLHRGSAVSIHLSHEL